MSDDGFNNVDPDAHPALEEQPVPEGVHCPKCGGDPYDSANHKLSATGYLHDDIVLVCSECAHSWTHGVPIGESHALADDLACPSCDYEYGLPHKPNLDTNDDGEFFTSMKCPDCNKVWGITREVDENGNACFGYPSITGNIKDANQSSW